MTKQNHYEKAFTSWLGENKIKYIPVDQAKRAAFRKAKIKSFDCIIHTAGSETILAEIKGRKFKGNSLDKNPALQSWVTMDDIDGLSNWQEIFGPEYIAAFVFAYEIENVNIQSDRAEIYEFDNRRYLFYIITLSDYKQNMVLRSPKWRTVCLHGSDFHSKSAEAKKVLAGREYERQNTSHSRICT